MSGSPVVTYSDGEHAGILAYECGITVERTERIGDAVSEKRIEMSGYIGSEVLQAVAGMMQKMVDA